MAIPLPRAQTLQQRFGFGDNDLKSPNHDLLMRWLVEQVPTLGNRWLKPIGFSEGAIQGMRKQAANAVKNAIASCLDNIVHLENSKRWSDNIPSIDTRIQEKRARIAEYDNWQGLGIPPETSIDLAKIEWEKPIMSGKYIIGFIDLVVWYTCPELAIAGLHSVLHNQLEDSNILPSWTLFETDIPVYFEVKTQIESIGELIRQINMYREYVKGIFIVVSPDDRCQDILTSQHIGFLKALL